MPFQIKKHTALTSFGARPKASEIFWYSSFTFEKSFTSFVALPCASWQWNTSSLREGIIDWGCILAAVTLFASGGGGGRVGVAFTFAWLLLEGLSALLKFLDFLRSFELLFCPNRGITDTLQVVFQIQCSSPAVSQYELLILLKIVQYIINSYSVSLLVLFP